LHVQEPDCAVQSAVAAAQVDAGRYRSYRVILDELIAVEAATSPGARRRHASTSDRRRSNPKGHR
jgi:hypothetical protein